MRNWIELCSDVNWEDYHGMWARKAKDGSWYVLQWTNLWDAAGKQSGMPQYDCEVKRLELESLSDPATASAIGSCGWRFGDGTRDIIDEHSGTVVAEAGTDSWTYALVECCIQYGYGAPLESFQGDHYPLRIRAQARRFAEECMRDAALVRERLARPVNAIGSTAAEIGRGDIDAALDRGSITFGTLQPDGQLVDVRHIPRRTVRACRFNILVPGHYRDDGSCRCDDPAHRATMIKEWGYSQDDFSGIPLR